MNLEMLKLRIEKRIDHNSDIIQFRKKLLSYHYFDLASVFVLLEKRYQHRFYEILSPQEFANIFSYIDLEKQIELSSDMHKLYFSYTLSYLPTDEATDILKELENKDELLKMMPSKKAAVLRSLILYDDDQAGSIMSTDYISIKSDMDVKEAMKTLKENALCEVIETLFVVDNGILEGVVSLKDLIIARSPLKVKEIAKKPIYVNTNDDVIYTLEMLKKYELKALPVVENGFMKGIVSADDWFDFMNDEAELDFNMLAGISFNDSNNGIGSSIKKRLPWLLVLLALSLIVSTIISCFDKVIAEVSILVLFQSLVLDMGGNCGTQSLAVAVRNISSNKVEKTSGYIFKELRIGFIDGLILGVASFLVSYIFLLIRHPNTPITISIVVGIAMMLTMIASTIMGAITPILFNKLKIDPAVASGPFISTVNDCLSVVIYYGLAAILIYMGVLVCL